MTARTGIIDNGTLTVGPETADAAAVVILAHGRGGSPADMQSLARAFQSPAVRFILPAAPGGSWYPESFLAPIERNEPWLSHALAACAAIVDGLIADGVRPENIVVGGFSQGACLTAEFLVRHPRPYGAALILTGGLIGPPGTRWPVRPALSGVPVYLSGSKTDAWVPPARVAETERVLTASGARVRLQVFENRGHTVSPEEVAAGRDLLARWTRKERRAGQN